MPWVYFIIYFFIICFTAKQWVDDSFQTTKQIVFVSWDLLGSQIQRADGQNFTSNSNNLTRKKCGDTGKSVKNVNIVLRTKNSFLFN